MQIAFDTDEGIGTRAAMGVIVLQADETLEHEFARIMAHPGLALYHSRIPMAPEVTPDTLAQMARDLPKAAALLPAGAGLDVIGYGCTSGATVIGSARVAELVQSAFPKARVTDPLAALIAGIKALGARRIGFVTPYIPEVSAGMRAALEAAGAEVVAFGSFMEGDDRVVARITPEAILQAITRVAAKAQSDAIIVACTNLRCLGILDEAERRIGRPVLSSNQALAWHMLRLAGVSEARDGMGRLFSCPCHPKDAKA